MAHRAQRHRAKTPLFAPIGAPLILSYVATQAGIAAVLIATVQAPHGIYSSAGAKRFVDVLIGGGASLAIAALLPVHPLKRTHAAATALFSELTGTLDGLATSPRRWIPGPPRISI